jgi:hypothetical protein
MNGGSALGWLIVLVVGAFIMFMTHGEHEGTIKYDDCREIERLAPDPVVQLFYKSFTCMYNKTKSGRIMGGVCVSIEEPWFGSGCTKAYVYEKKAAAVCPVNTHLTYEDICACNDGFGWNASKQQCEWRNP